MSRLKLIEEYPGYYTVEGQLTFATIDKQSLQSFKFLKGIDQICIDLQHVEKTDSAGLALMIEWIKHSKANRVQLIFKNIPAQLRALAKLSGFDQNMYFDAADPN